MSKSMIAAAAFAAMAASFSGGASAAVTGSGLGGVHAAAIGEVVQAHYRSYHHRHHWRLRRRVMQNQSPK